MSENNLPTFLKQKPEPRDAKFASKSKNKRKTSISEKNRLQHVEHKKRNPFLFS